MINYQAHIRKLKPAKPFVEHGVYKKIIITSLRKLKKNKIIGSFRNNERKNQSLCSLCTYLLGSKYKSILWTCTG